MKSLRSEAIDGYFFGRPNVSRKDFFDDDDEFAFIVRQDVANEVIEQFAYRSNFMDNLRKWIKADESNGGASEEDLSDFLHFCTGQRFVPDLDVHEMFKITIEFNSKDDDMVNPEQLPISHTCAMTIKFPSSAYGGENITEEQQYQTFKKKMKQAISMVGASFDME